MIDRRKFISTCMATLLMGGHAHADIKDVVISQLKQQGFRDIRIGRTFFGRTRILATSPQLRREIIINPRTGEILRDYWEEIGPGPAGGEQIISSSVPGDSGEDHDDGTDGNGGTEDDHGGDDDGDDDHGGGDDDDDDDDHGGGDDDDDDGDDDDGDDDNDDGDDDDGGDDDDDDDD